MLDFLSTPFTNMFITITNVQWTKRERWTFGGELLGYFHFYSQKFDANFASPCLVCNRTYRLLFYFHIFIQSDLVKFSGYDSFAVCTSKSVWRNEDAFVNGNGDETFLTFILPRFGSDQLSVRGKTDDNICASIRTNLARLRFAPKYHGKSIRIRCSDPENQIDANIDTINEIVEPPVMYAWISSLGWMIGWPNHCRDFRTAINLTSIRTVLHFDYHNRCYGKFASV